ncbi:sensor histidine kinase [Paenibacillus mucilaginosus]|uniref:histidine kinase n=2 Tax=Paenibacillus mucilaginosus TaxID=61624 RepID=H6NK34_9BACL|nr:HAMP domain-containing sensor histidine kinase [Paenibacillus mucilaginosus]AEI43229.1 periplasmic sensor signal transduction histidine kinase [Paenibacillus mucilaginosus KNP414]AFC30887.1 periplasmic sensor signal transduction histidine kinase [Paenibacillus mucilaginosus 3016]MCG7212215.1 HAMP domain-containing histidine kinase [Paenibacillus mucilaginosus]WDM24818.1 HAMP domain-containing histidine kinase [Paenibacillus mucilaginosus]WFA19488.1 HAMP domain-containing histidine kinase [P
MQLTKRFFLMNTLAVLLSIALTALAAVIFVAVYTELFGREAQIRQWERAFEVRTGLSEIQREAMTRDFGGVADPSYQQELSQRVKALGAHAILLKNREVLFATRTFSRPDVEKSLLLTAVSPHEDTVELDGTTYLIARASYELPSGEDGVLLLLAPLKLNTSFYLLLGSFVVGFFVLTFLLLNAWVSYRFSRGIILPVTRLRNAAVHISRGDLDFGIAEEGDDEVRELCRTLELMRIKLKESVYLQQKYDENRNFLVSSISHDLKTPVTSIKGYIEGIIDGVARTPEKRAEYLETARSKAVLVNTMIDDLLLYSKLDLQQLPYHFERTDLYRYFEDCAAEYRHEFDLAGITLEFVSELSAPAAVYIDRERLKRVIQNILDNAAKYVNQADGRVELRLRETRTSAIIEIRDNGPGIPEGDLPHIFDRFYRVDASRKNADGSGLGLAIAKQIVEGHGGTIWARSAPGEGTRIMISLKKSGMGETT